MANLDQSFDVVGTINDERGAAITKAVKALTGVNRVTIDARENKVIVGYTPGVIAIRSIKETIESPSRMLMEI